MNVLEVGCGWAKEPGAVGIDIAPHPKVDIICDINRFPWPLKDSSFKVILCKDVIEHVDNVVKTMEEIHRTGKPNARVVIDTPHFANPNSFRDPTHKWHFSYDTFDYFSKDFVYPIYSDKKFNIIKKEFIFRRKLGMGSLLSKLSARRYEKYHSHRYPPYKLHFELEISK